MDQGHIETEKLLVALERRIEKVYGEASKDLQKKADAYFAKFIERDKKQQELLKAGKITEEQYKQWRLAQMGRGERFIALRDDLAKRMTEANKVAVSYINDETPSIYSLNHNYAAYEIEQAAGNVGFTIYDEQTVRRLIAEDPTLLPKRRVDATKDLKWNKKRFTAEITAGILSGESIGKLANRVQNLSDANRSGATRNARTAVTGAQNAGRQESYNQAKKMGLKLSKRWIATKDNRTRHEHAMLDGQTVPLDKPFQIDGHNLMFPGDPTGLARLVWNCRCTMRTVEKEGIEAEPRQMRVRNPETGRNELISEMTYAEWAGWKKAEIKKAAKTPETINEAINMARDLGVKYAQFEKMPLEQVVNVIDAVRTLPKDCVPKVVASGKDVSIVTGRPLGRKADQWWGVTYDYRSFSLRTMQLGYEKTDLGGGLIVGLNTQKFKTIDAITKAKQDADDRYFAKTGRHWNFNTDGKATAYHEIGHCFVDVRGLPKGWEEASSRWANESACDLLKKPEEAFAEAWAAYYLGDERLPKYISEIIGGLR